MHTVVLPTIAGMLPHLGKRHLLSRGRKPVSHLTPPGASLHCDLRLPTGSIGAGHSNLSRSLHYLWYYRGT